jgi:serine/threonine-protein kinase HipA
MSVEGKFREVTDEDMIALGERHGVPRMSLLLAQVRAAVDSWSQFAAQARLPAVVAARVAKDLRNRV